MLSKRPPTAPNYRKEPSKNDEHMLIVTVYTKTTDFIDYQKPPMVLRF